MRHIYGGKIMSQTIVRLQELEIKNIKNVEYGKVEMPNSYQQKRTYDNSEILGLYGQNGSGKTAIIDAMYFLQQIMIGESIEEQINEYINMKKDYAELRASFMIFEQEILYDVDYDICINRKEDNSIFIKSEKLSCSKITNENKKNKRVFMEFQRESGDTIFTPRTRLNELLSEIKGDKTDLIVAKKMAEKSNSSYIFGANSREIFLKDYQGKFQQYSFIIKKLFEFAVKDLFVIRNAHSGVITANIILPMAFRIDNGNSGAKGDLAVSLEEPTVLDKEDLEMLRHIIKEINIVLYTIIPGLNINIKEYGSQLMDNGEEGYKVELMSSRDGMPAFPIRMESEGIIKIISILNALIRAFGNSSICLAIDELDAGIFEYILGELLKIFGESAKGQLIFTSHNLRALEMLDKESIMFSTTNSKNEYIHMKNIKKSNNLRDVYLRSITLGGQKEEIYKETSSLKIARAFRKAGRGVKYNE